MTQTAATQESKTVISQERFLDIWGAKVGVDVTIRDDGKVLWVSVDGRTVLRICQIPSLELYDDRMKAVKP
ncbi:MAG: hypothetical protein KAJ19_10190 [Gammaproteobacteria bacterium]|nr:hypothetical protein [Gammaproteobacteria bacterium]